MTALPAKAAPPGRLLALPLGAAVCAFGLAALALVLTAPQDPGVAELPPLQTARPDPAAAGPSDTAEPRVWAPLFGTAPEPEPEPPPTVAETGPPPLAPLEVRLRGVALDEDGGWALIEQGDRVVLVRPGSALTEDHTVESILTDGVVIASRDGAEILGFEEDGVSETVASRMQTSLQRAIMSGQHDFDQLPMPLPPADYVPGPGFAGPDNL